MIKTKSPEINPPYIWSSDSQMPELGCMVFSTNRVGKLDTHGRRKKPDSYFTQTVMESGRKEETVKGLREGHKRSVVPLVLTVTS